MWICLLFEKCTFSAYLTSNLYNFDTIEIAVAAWSMTILNKPNHSTVIHKHNKNPTRYKLLYRAVSSEIQFSKAKVLRNSSNT